VISTKLVKYARNWKIVETCMLEHDRSAPCTPGCQLPVLTEWQQCQPRHLLLAKHTSADRNGQNNSSTFVSCMHRLLLKCQLPSVPCRVS
jgi:hypothetical protein